MNKKVFDRRMESAIGGLLPSLDFWWFMLIMIIFIVIGFIYFIASTSIFPEVSNYNVDSYCRLEAMWGCLYIPVSFLRADHVYLPWSFLPRYLLLFPTIGVSFILAGILKITHHWKSCWIAVFLFKLCLLNWMAAFGETLIYIGLINFFWREIFSNIILFLMIFILTLPTWNRKLVALISKLKWFILISSGAGAFALYFRIKLDNLFTPNNSGLPIFLWGLLAEIIVILIVSVKTSQRLWNASPWRLKREILTKEKEEDPSAWIKIKEIF